jgi:hypothetical protein
MSNKQVFARERVGLTTPVFHEILRRVGGFHDANVSMSTHLDGNWIVELSEIYFLEERTYNICDVTGCHIHFGNCRDIDPRVLEKIAGRDLFIMSVLDNKVSITFSYDGMELSNIEFDQGCSFFQWKFGSAEEP